MRRLARQFMLNILLAAYLLIIAPLRNLRRSLRPKSGKPRRPLLRQYWSMSWPVIVMLAVLVAGVGHAGWTARQLGFDLPLSKAGAWGLGFAVLLLAGLIIAGAIIERRKSPEALAKSDRELLDSGFPWPRTPAESLAFAASVSLMSAAWEILYRGFLLLLLTPSVGLPFAIAAAALAYGIAHGYKNSKQLIGALIAAFVFTIAYALTHSLWWLIVIHAGLPLTAIPAALRAQRRREGAIDDATLEQV